MKTDVSEYVFSCGGKELAQVLYYYGLIPDVNSTEYKIVCPLHNDVNPSMMIDLQKGTFFCFGCQESGDAFSLVKKLHPELNDLQAGLLYFRILKSKKVERITVSKNVKIRKPSKQAYIEAHDYYYGLSTIDWKTDQSEEVVEARQYMKQRGFSSATLNMCKAKVTYNFSYPIIFPMLDNKHFAGWVCRTDKPHIEHQRKYLYNEGFCRRNTLVGTYGSKDYVIVVEGYMDRLRMLQNLHRLGYHEDIVAILGWKMSSEQIQKLRDSGIRYVISALDNDPCGRRGTEYLKTLFKVTRFSYLKGIKDPGEMETEAFEKMYKKTMNKLAHDRRKQ
jgi:DNA primase